MTQPETPAETPHAASAEAPRDGGKVTVDKSAVDDIAQAIRTADGDHTMGAGALAEVVVDAMAEWLNEQATAYVQHILDEIDRDPESREVLSGVAVDINNGLLLAADWLRGRHAI